MKRLVQFLFFLTVCISAHGQASGLADLKFGQYQVADSQWNVSACMYTATCQIYSKQPGTAYKIPWFNGQLSWGAGDYVAFVPTGDATNPWNAIQYTVPTGSKVTNAQTFLAIMLIMSKCDSIVINSGNIGLWTCLYRGNNKKVHQFLHPKNSTEKNWYTS
jgi:hypothetical protein